MVKSIYYRKNSFFSSPKRLLIAISFLLFLHGCNNETKEIRILFTGDILLSRNVQIELDKRQISPWHKMKDLFQSVDMVIGNLEGAVGNSNDSLPSAIDSPVFDIPRTSIALLADAGFKVISIENNHSFDLGDKGKAETIKELINSKISPVFYNNSPRFLKFQNTTIALIAINLIPDRKNSFQEIPSIEIKQKLRLAKNLANLTIVTIHWGSELLEWPNQFQRKAAEWLVNNGADLIIGSHPHVVQQPEMINGKPVFFSLGNHLFDQKYLGTKKGLIADCRIRNGKLECEGIVTHTSKNSFFPENIASEKYSLEKVDLESTLIVSDYSISGKSIEDIEGKTILQGNNNDKKIWETHPMSMVSLATSRLDGKQEYLITLEKHFSNMDGEINLRPYVYTITEAGLFSRWRGSALAWPLLDATILPGNEQILCALHRGDSFINLIPITRETRTAAYKWNGFGFIGENDSSICAKCKEYITK